MITLSHSQMWELADKLRYYSSLCNDEYGETCYRIAELLSNYIPLNKDFVESLIREAQWHLENFEENTKIVKKTVVQETVVEELEWLEEED